MSTPTYLEAYTWPLDSHVMHLSIQQPALWYSTSRHQEINRFTTCSLVASCLLECIFVFPKTCPVSPTKNYIRKEIVPWSLIQIFPFSLSSLLCSVAFQEQKLDWISLCWVKILREKSLGDAESSPFQTKLLMFLHLWFLLDCFNAEFTNIRVTLLESSVWDISAFEC